ncbi:MFS transporter [Pediococcus pentosaceus]|uniref:MFS transporter n=1 Tax=Pediococcus pentosaceus TaxID=1255 RepID=UPI0025AF7502|nr:MFS transporter [Pediococcus pentosaceus]MDN3206655.1 MFS transporter [Pediococcus pentosaceus]
MTHVPANQVSFFLMIYGVAIAIGNTLGGKLGNAKPINALFGIFIVQGYALFAFYFTVTNIYLSTLNIVLLGLVAFMSVPVLQSYILILAKSYSSKAVDVASSLNISAFSFGIVGGSFLGGVALDTYGLRSTMLLAAAMVALAVLMMLVENKFENKRQK